MSPSGSVSRMLYARSSVVAGPMACSQYVYVFQYDKLNVPTVKTGRSSRYIQSLYILITLPQGI